MYSIQKLHVKTLVVSLFLLPLLVFAAIAAWNGKVVGVTDGDTIKVLKDGKVTKVRLYGVDSPEKKQPWGVKAKARASDLCFEKNVRVEPVTIDHYGRVVARVYLPDNRELGATLIAEGYAWWYREYAKKQYQLDSLQNIARSRKLGLWSEKNPTPPWEWRKAKRKKSKH